MFLKNFLNIKVKVVLGIKFFKIINTYILLAKKSLYKDFIL